MPSTDGHGHVHEHDVRLGGGDEGLRLGSIGGGADDLDVVGERDHLLEPGTDDGVVVDENDADHPVGTSSVTRVPWPGAESMSRRAPKSAAASASSVIPRCPPA